MHLYSTSIWFWLIAYGQLSVSEWREPTDNGLLLGKLFSRTDWVKPVSAMAESSQRFATLTKNDVQQLLYEKEVKNTKRVTKMFSNSI